jgi:cytochrome c peroxidase
MNHDDGRRGLRAALSLILSPAIALGVTCGAVLLACGDAGDPAAPGPKDASPDSLIEPFDASSTDSGGGENDCVSFSDTEVAQIKTLSPLPSVPKDSTNKYADDPNAAKLGQMLFYEDGYSGKIVIANDGTNGGLGNVGEEGKVSCASCHAGAALADTRSKPGNVSLGTDYGTRNALAVVNSAFYPWTNWGGRFDSQWSLPPAVAENARIMAGNRLALAHLIWNKYKAEYELVFGALDPDLDPASANAARFPPAGKPKANAADPDGPWELMAAADRTIVNTILANFGKAIQAYQRLLVSRNAPLDKYVAGERSALSCAAKRGLKIFLGKGGCIQCHSGPFLSDGKFHALAVPQTGAKVPATDLGRYADVPALLASPFNVNGAFSDDKTTSKLNGLAQDPSQRGEFRTPTLRGTALSGPYMHAGQFSTLKEVFAFYAAGGGDPGDAGITKYSSLKPFPLQGSDEADLQALMEALSGDPIPSTLTQDTSK